ncbi:MAG: integral rane sensor signal transduction histidine kinase, partial [Clostridiales bacterium]|nr:integral rane sensor signal transduction histidine kinase [Clostridiales bacterium]
MLPFNFRKKGNFLSDKSVGRPKLPKFKRDTEKPSRNFRNIFKAIQGGDFFNRLLRKFKIQQRLIVAFLFLSMVPLLIMGVFSYNKAKDAIHMKISTYSVQVMNGITENMKSEILKYENILAVIGYSDQVQMYSSYYRPNDAYESMRVKNETLKVFRDNATASKEITEVALIPDKLDPLSIYGFKNANFDGLKEFLKEVAADKSSTPHWTIAKGDTTSLVVAREIIDTKGNGRPGIAMIGVDQSYIASKFETVDIGQGSEIIILDAKGLVLSSRNKNIPILQNYADKELINEIVKADKEEKRFFNYKNQLVTYSVNNITGWYTVGLIPYTYLNSEVSSIAYGIAFLIILCMLVAILLSFIVSGSIASPLKRLVGLMVEASNGNLTINIEDKSRDEIGNVVNNFNNMVTNIRSLVAKVNSLSHNVLDSSEKIFDSAEKSFSASEQIS